MNMGASNYITPMCTELNQLLSIPHAHPPQCTPAGLMKRLLALLMGNIVVCRDENLLGSGK